MCIGGMAGCCIGEAVMKPKTSRIEVTMVRIYLTEKEDLLETILKQLHDEENVRGVTVFRGITGFGKSRTIHASSLLDMSLNLPLVVEFFDAPDKAAAIIEHFSQFIPSDHIVSWSAEVNF